MKKPAVKRAFGLHWISPDETLVLLTGIELVTY